MNRQRYVLVDTKKQKELLYVKLFKSQFADFPAGEILESERPDVLVHSESGCVGIEVTEVFRSVSHGGYPIQKRESELHRIMQRARELYEQAGLPPVIVRAYFSDRPFSRADLLPTATKLVEIVSRNLPDGYGEKVEDYDWLNRDIFGDKIHTVTVTAIHRLLGMNGLRLKQCGYPKKVQSCCRDVWMRRK